MDGSIFTEAWHPSCEHMKRDWSRQARHVTRTERPPKYCFIDFGISRRYDPKDGPPTEYPALGEDKTVPEFQNSYESHDPFPTDVYYLGNLVRQHFIEVGRHILPSLLVFLTHFYTLTYRENRDLDL